MQVFVVGSFVIAYSAMVARLPRPGESLDAAAFCSEPGGKGFNLALAAHRLGARVDGAFAIGDDAFATLAFSAFRKAGLSVDMLVQHPGSTGAGIGFIDAQGENCIAVSLGANRLLAPEDVARAGPALDGAGLVMASFEAPDAPIHAAFARARRNGAITLLNPSPGRPIDPGLLADTKVLVVNGVEAADLGLTVDEPGSAEALLRAGPEIVVVTLGTAGAVAFRREGPACRQPAFPVAAIDTIGAGDAFAAALGVGLLQGLPLAETLRRAAAGGALTAARLGAFDAFPLAAELEDFLATARS